MSRTAAHRRQQQTRGASPGPARQVHTGDRSGAALGGTAAEGGNGHVASPPGPTPVPSRLARLLDTPGAYSTIARSASPPLSASYVSRVLSGASRPSLDVASRMADAIGISLAAFERYLIYVQAQWDTGERPERKPRKGKNPRAKLDRDRAMQIRAILATAEEEGEGVTYETLAAEFGVSRQAISDIARGVWYAD